MKVTKLNNNLNSSKKKFSKKIDKTEHRKFEDIVEVSVFEEISKTSSVHSSNNLEELFIQLETYETNLADIPSDANFFKYKNHLKKITSIIHKSNYKIRQIELREGFNTTQMQVVQVVNKKLADIFSLITRRNPETVKILFLMGEIKGLLLENIKA